MPEAHPPTAALRQRALPGGHVLTLGQHTVLVGCGDGLARDWAGAGLPPRGPGLLLLPDGAPERIAGLYGLFAMMVRGGRRRGLRVVAPLTDDRVGPLIGAFLQSEPVGFPVEVEAELPGAELALGGLTVRLRPGPLGLAFHVRAAGLELPFYVHA